MGAVINRVGMNWRLVVQTGIAVAVIYALCWGMIFPDLRMYLFPWIEHIRANGVPDAFAAPFGNYAPLYLYLLALVAQLTASNLIVVKSLAVAATLVAALGMRRLVSGDDGNQAALITLLLPTVIVDGVLFGQCDGFWAGCSLLAVDAAVDGRLPAMVLWAGIAFAFKAQAVFIAPFVIAMLVRRRAAPWLWLIPPALYVLAALPAWLAGWPASDLATIYWRQAQYFNTIGSAPGLWAIPAALLPRAPLGVFWIGQLAALLFCGWYVVAVVRRTLSRSETIEAALLCALALPFILPKMHERFTLLADLLALTLVFAGRDRRSLFICIAVQVASALGYAGYMTAIPALPVVGAAINALVVVRLTRGIVAVPPGTMMESQAIVESLRRRYPPAR
jgi:Gpi18-like mannosyltransferase